MKLKHLLIIFLLLCTLNLLSANELLIRNIIFSGNQSFPDRALHDIIRSRENHPVNRRLLNDDAQRLNDFYEQRGITFFKVYNPLILPMSSGYVDVVFTIEEIREPIIDNVLFTGNSYFSRDKIYELTERNPDDILYLSAIDSFMNEIRDLYLSRGFLFVTIMPDNLETLHIDNKDVLQITISINEGQIVRSENIIFRGNEITRDNILLSQTRIRQGQIITPTIINDAKNRLEHKQYIQYVNIVPVNTNTLLIDLNEGNMTRLSGALGFSNSENNKNSFNGYIDTEFLNILGTDRNLSFIWRNFDNNFTSVLFKYHESGPINIPIAADFILYREERDSTSVRTQFETDIYYQYINQKYGISMGINQLFPGSRRPVILEKQNERMVGFFWQGDFTDNYLNPRNGWEFNYSQQFLFVQRGENRIQRNKFDVSISTYQSLNRSIVLANSITGNFLENKDLTQFDLLKAGGSNTIRGFHQDFFEGNTILYTNSELRFLLNRTSRIFLFLDYAYIEDNRINFNNKFSDLFGMGLGLRTESRIGLLKIDYGFHHANKKWLNPLNGMIHFGIETGF